MSDPFSTLGLPARFDLSDTDIERAYFERSRAVHPDRVAAGTAAERVAALTASRAVNDAYQAVRRPHRRAEALLALAGERIAEHERLPAAMIEEVLALREQLAEAKHAGDLGAITAMRAAMEARRSAIVNEFAPLFAAARATDAAAGPGGAESALSAVKARLISLRYVDRYLEECDAALDAADHADA